MTVESKSSSPNACSGRSLFSALAICAILSVAPQFAAADDAGEKVEDLSAEDAREDPLAACLETHERSQLLRMDGMLLEAEAALRRCAETSCPSIVRDDCTTWLAEVRDDQPTVMPLAISDRGDERDVAFFVDDELMTETLDGEAFPVNPGLHRFRFELPDREPVEMQRRIYKGEKDREIEARFASLSRPSAPEPPATSQPEPRPESPPAIPGPRVPTGAYVLGATSLAAFGAFAYLGVTALRDRSAALERCAPFCNASETGGIRRRLIAADVALGIGIASGVAALLVYFIRRPRGSADSREQASLWFGVDPGIHAARLEMGGVF